MSIKTLLVRMLDRITAPVVTRTYSNSTTFGSGNYTVGHVDITLAGYKPLGVVAIMPAVNTVIYGVTFYEISGNQLNYTVRAFNGATSGTTISSRFDVLYTKVGGVLTSLKNLFLKRGCFA